MIAIENIFISDEVVEEQFVCDLHKCKGGCCIDGDAGAPLTNEELEEVNAAIVHVKHLLTKEGQLVIETEGNYTYDREFGWVTPTISNGMCAYGLVNEQGIVKCSFEQVYNEGKIKWKKPISCHLYPIKISKSENTDQEYVNYEPRDPMCNPGCALGQKLKVPTYVFLKEAIVRKYGEEFYEVLTQIADQYYSNKSNK
ncbi:DUF3109 family protein [Lacibacter sp. H407]|uniref:DUF3109 family protein n=1 Tax=Lacibacter sp. H407 TaxID=3133423 RepID=UPI0030C63E09